MKKILTVVIILVLLAGGGWYFYHKRSAQAEEQQGVRTTSEQVNNYYTVKKGSITKTITANGSIRSAKEKDLMFLTGGRVKEIMLEEGQQVEKGQLLAKLDNASEELSVFKAKNNYESAQINSSKNVQAERKIELQIAERNYQDTFLYAPFSGLITEMNMDVNDQVGASKAVGHIIDDKNYMIEVFIDEVDISQIKKGQRVGVSLEAFPQMRLTGEVVNIGLVAANQGGVVSVPVEIAVKNVGPQVKSGLSASVEIIVGQATDVTLVPITGVISRQDGSYVMKKVDGKPQAVKVSTDISNDIMIAVVEGLNEGDEVIVNNYQMMSNIRNQSQQRNSFGQRQGNQPVQRMIMPGGGGR